MANEKEPYVLIGLYISLYKERYGKDLTVNKFREKWAMNDVIESVGFQRAKELLIYYFSTNKTGHPLNFFYNNFDRIDALNKEIKKKTIEPSYLYSPKKGIPS